MGFNGRLGFLTLFGLIGNLVAATCTEEIVRELKEATFAMHALRSSREAISQCQDPSAARLRRFVDTVLVVDEPGRSLGLTMTDAEYHRTPHPGMLDLPPELKTQEFLKWLEENSAESLDKALAYIEALGKGWTAFLYESQHLPTPDASNSLGRFFVHVPGRKFEQFLQFGLQHRPGGSAAKNLSIVAIQKTDPVTGFRLPKLRGRVTDLRRVHTAEGISIVSRLEEVGKLENCYDCHKQLLLPITPKPASFNETRFGRALRQINDRMEAYAGIAGDGVDIAAWGPAIGRPGQAGRDDAFFDACAARHGVPRLRYPAIADAMRCASCHDGDIRGRLNYPSILHRVPEGASLVHFYVREHQKMPPNTTLSDGERAALVDCLKKEHYEVTLPQWLRGG